MSLRIPGFSWIGSNVTNGNSYENNGQQPKILLHMTVSHSLSMSYAQSHPYPPQCWANPYTGDKWQSIECDRAGLALYQPPYSMSWLNKNWYCIQTELIGVPEVNVVTYTEQQSKWIGENVIAPQWRMLQSVGVNVNLDNYRYHTNSSSSASEYWGGRMGDAEFFNFNGVLAHIDAFGNDHWNCSVERVDKWVAYAKAVLGQGGGTTPPPVVTDEDDLMMRIVEQVGGGGAHGSGTIWAISPTEPKAWPISNPYTVSVMQAHGVLMTWDQMRAKKYTYQTDGGSIATAYQVMPVIEAQPDSKGSPGPASSY